MFGELIEIKKSQYKQLLREVVWYRENISQQVRLSSNVGKVRFKIM
jgi:hypothetical protein